MSEVLRMILRWTAAWTLIGVIGGVAMMFAKVPPIAEPGSEAEGVWFFAFWIPVFAAAAGIVGFVKGGTRRLKQGAMWWGNMAHASCSEQWRVPLRGYSLSAWTTMRHSCLRD